MKLCCSGSRGVGNRIGMYFIERAKQDMRRWFINLPDADLAYLSQGSPNFDDYVEAVSWAQDFATNNRAIMMEAVLQQLALALGRSGGAARRSSPATTTTSRGMPALHAGGPRAGRRGQRAGEQLAHFPGFYGRRRSTTSRRPCSRRS